jgi:hypothetical protein
MLAGNSHQKQHIYYTSLIMSDHRSNQQPANRNLTRANREKKDEFYTQLSDIEKELRHYRQSFQEKTVYCNCDDPFESNFFKFFAMNFNAFGLKRLMTTSYDQSWIAGEQLPLFDIEGLQQNEKKAFKIIIDHVPDLNEDGAIDLLDVESLLRSDGNVAESLEGNGDFRSRECLSLLEQSDIVVTNPPFSLFREYLDQLIKYEKKFLILGDQNHISYKDVFRYVREDKVWLGYDNGGNKWFQVPMDYEINTPQRVRVENGRKFFSMGRIVWFTNLPTTKRNEFMNLYKKFNPSEFPSFDNYDAIEVSRIADIPFDYPGAMAVPITFLSRYNPKQFEILNSNDIRKSRNVPFKEHGLIKDGDGTVAGMAKYVRIVIRHRQH